MDTLSFCQAKSKQSGNRCKNVAVRNRKVCHIHGGKTPKHNSGPKTKEGLLRQKLASCKHGLRSKERILEAREVKNLIRSYKNIIKMTPI